MHLTCSFSFVKNPAHCLVAVFLPVTWKVLRRSQITKIPYFPSLPCCTVTEKNIASPRLLKFPLVTGQYITFFLHQNTTDFKMCHRSTAMCMYDIQRKSLEVKLLPKTNLFYEKKSFSGYNHTRG